MALKKKEVGAPEPKPSQVLPWPQADKDLSLNPRLYRMHRLSPFEWQAFVYDPVEGAEYAIGKPDLFEIVKSKISGLMRSEGQIAFLAHKKTKETQVK